MQFFGSTVERFVDSKSQANKKDLTQLGPGHYEMPSSLFMGGDKKHGVTRPSKNVGFVTSSPRFKGQTAVDASPSKKLVPGPGTYQHS